MAIDLSIVIPTYNEAGRIGKSLQQLSEYLKKTNRGVEVILVDASSPDGTQKEAQKYASKFTHFKIIDAGPKPPKQFIKGKQVQQGMLAASGKYVMFMDADMATPLKYLQNVFSIIERKVPVGICVRDLGKSHKGIRKFVSSLGNFLVQLLILPGIKDTQCGFKVFEKSAAQKIFSRQTIMSWGFDMEVLAIARNLNYRIEQINVPDWQDIEKGSKIAGTSAVKAALQTFPDLIKIKWGLVGGKYKTPNVKNN